MKLTGRFTTLIIALGLFGLNAALVWPLFTGGYTPFLISTESTFLADARFIAAQFPTRGWNPWWYLGFPFHLFYPPALPYLTALLSALAGLPVSSAYRLLTGLCYALGPATFFLFARYLTGKTYPAALAAFIYSLAPSLAYLIPAVRADALSMAYAPWQLIVLLRYGEGPHTAALTLMPLAALALLRALREPRYGTVVTAALAVAGVALFNWIGLFALTFILAVVVVAELVTSLAGRKLLTLVLIGLLAYGLAAFWFNLPFIRAGTGWGSGAGAGGFGGLLTSNWLAVPMIGVPLAVLLLIFFSGSPQAQPALTAGLWLIVFAVITWSWYLGGTALVPQPNRYIPELGLGAALTLALALEGAASRLAGRPGRAGAALAVLLRLAAPLAVIISARPYLAAARGLTQPNADITATSEYQVAGWLSAHVQGDERAYLTGSHAFWLNVFSDVPQVRGGADYAAVNTWWDDVAYQINTGSDGAVAVLWARALDLRYLVVSFPGSADVYQDYARPEKFEGLLAKAYDNHGMAIYEVPLTNPGLVRLVNLTDYDRLPLLRDAADAEALRQYVQFVEAASPVTGYRRVSTDRLELLTDLAGADQGLLVRMTYDRGWRAFCNGEPIPIRADRVGFLLVEPRHMGGCRLVLQHEATVAQWLGYALTAVTLLLLALRHPRVLPLTEAVSTRLSLWVMGWRIRRLGS